MSVFQENVAAGVCGKCKAARAADDGGTRTLCRRCGDGLRRRNRGYYRAKVGIPADAPLAKQGRPRVSPGPQPPF